MMEQDSLINKNILANMNGGVITVDPAGQIMTFNPAAARLLGLEGEEVEGRLMAEVLLTMEGADEFVQAILDAVYNAGQSQQRVVEMPFKGGTRSLALTTSFLKEERGQEVRELGVIALFNDITELRELREAELRLAESVKEQHAQLQDAYLQIEESNRTLASTMKRVRLAAFLIIGLFLLAGLLIWRGDSPAPVAAESSSARASGADVTTVVVTAQRVASTISLSGKLAPWQEVEITSSITGNVMAIHFQHGEQVFAGQRLVELDTSEVEREYRDAQAAHIKAQQRFNEVDDWMNSAEVARAQRSISKARMDLETQKDELVEAAFLLEQGLIPAAEHDAAVRQLRNQQLDYESVQSDLEAVLAKGGAEEKQVARLELDNAYLHLQALEADMRGGTINAPISGVILQPRADAAGEGAKAEAERLVPGKSVTRGEHLLSIGNIERLSVTAEVDEVNISQIHVGQQVRVTGDAFPGLELRGSVVHVSSQASGAQSDSQLPSFKIRISLEDLTEAQRSQLRLGMSTDLEVVVYESPDALVVPIGAVETDAEGTWLRVQDNDDDETRRVRVEVGITTVDAVEIRRGIAAGDKVVW